MPYEIKKVFASLPQVERGVSKIVGGDPEGNNFLYTNGKCVVIRNIDDMAVAIALIVALLALQCGLKSDHQLDVAMAQCMQQREEYLHQEMSHLLQEVEQRESADEATLISVWQQWPLWTLAAALVLLAAVCWLARERKLASDHCSEQDSSSSEEEHGEVVEDLTGAHHSVRSSSVLTPSPMQGLPNTCKVLKELVGDLLGVCKVLCKTTFMPQMPSAWSVQENNITYRLCVFLQPPPGHSFSTELDATGQLPARSSSIHVVLECTCLRDKMLGESSCFHHHLDNELPRDQSSFLLRTLCTHSYLDMEKVVCWVQSLVRSAWLLLPESHHCQLTVLPSSQSCRFQLTSPSKINMFIELIFAVEEAARAPT